eukprot:Skav203564  [mRNA]  locus=scaffold3576:167903:177292:+ [translate_table: standard]
MIQQENEADTLSNGFRGFHGLLSIKALDPAFLRWSKAPGVVEPTPWLALALAVTCHAQLMRRESGRPSSRSSRLQGALRQVLSQVSAEQESLRDSYEAFPKDAKGNLPPHQALPALARAYFAKAREHGWLVRGLETPGAPIIAPGESYQQASDPHGAGDLYEVHALQELRMGKTWRDKAPELAAALKEAALSPAGARRGMSLADISQTVAAILLEESVPLLRSAYVLNELETEIFPDPITMDEAHEVVMSYLLLFRHGLPLQLEEGRRVEELEELGVANGGRGKLKGDAKKHAEMKERARQVSTWKDMKKFEASAINESGEAVPWTMMKEGVMNLAKRYGRWQNSECEEMKSSLVKMDGAAGRVRLADFHGSPKYPHFSFTEKEDYLRQVQTLARELNASALEELSDAADGNGVVLWHSPGFRRWLHRAFPLQCPRPTAMEDEAITAELTEAQEWMEIDEAARQKWKPLVLQPSECTRLPEWQDTPEESAALEV